MTFWNILYLVGIMIACVGVMQILPLALSVGFGDGYAASLALSCAASVLAGLLLVRAGGRKRRTILSNSEALACVGLCWIAATCAGALPYVSTGFMNPVDAWFESVSGFTTTGSSILSDIEALPQSLLFWRSLTQWCGGMGIIVLSLAVLPHLGVGGMQLYRAEVPGPTPDKLAPRIQDTAKILWSGYCVLTAVMVVCLMMAGMNVLDAVNHAFTTLATGGFSTKNASAAAFSPAVQWIIIVFMFLAGINFTLHFRFISGRWNAYSKSDECRFFVLLCAVLTLLTAGFLYVENSASVQSFSDAEKLLRGAMFQIVSLLTSTGFVSENYSLWPLGTMPMLMFAVFVGGCVGSTAGGFKIMRIMVLGKVLRREFFSMLHPRGVYTIKFQDRPLSEKIISGSGVFFITYMLMLFLCTGMLLCWNIDFLTSFSAVLTCLSNAGPGFGRVGAVDNFGWMPQAAKIILSFCMLAGRLEFYALLILLHPSLWRRPGGL